MRLEPMETCWIVVNPTRSSELADICFSTTLNGLEAQIKGGMSLAKEEAEWFMSREAAEVAASRRLLARDVAVAIRAGHLDGPADAVKHVTLEDGRGQVVLGAKLPGR